MCCNNNSDIPKPLKAEPPNNAPKHSFHNISPVPPAQRHDQPSTRGELTARAAPPSALAGWVWGMFCPPPPSVAQSC